VADVGQEPALGLVGRGELLGLVVELGVERHHAAVGLLQLFGELVVKRHDAAVGLFQLGVEAGQFVTLRAHLVESGDELLILRVQLVDGAAGDVPAQPGTDLVHAVRGQPRHTGR
jgi:hypothetical protein